MIPARYHVSPLKSRESEVPTYVGVKCYHVPGQLPPFKIGQIYLVKAVVLNTITSRGFSESLLLFEHFEERVGEVEEVKLRPIWCRYE